MLAGLQQPLLLGEPLLLAFQTLQCLLLLETRLGVGFQRRLEPGPGLLGQGQAAFQALLELLALLVGLAGALIGGFAQLAVQAGVGEFLQQCAAVVVAGLEEGAEFALGQQHGASELGEIEAELLLQLFAELAFLVRCQHLLGLQVLEALLALLQGAVRLVPGAPGFPAGAIAVAVDADEIPLRRSRWRNRGAAGCVRRCWTARSGHREPCCWPKCFPAAACCRTGPGTGRPARCSCRRRSDR